MSKDTPADEEDLDGMDGKGKENIDNLDEVANIPKGLSKPGSNLPLDELDFANANIKILKPETNDKPVNVISKKNRKKNKKQRPTVSLETLLPSPLDSSSSEQNAYVAKIRRLNAQKEALEGGPSSTTNDGAEDGPVLDPHKPSYTPQHLLDSPDALQSLFAGRTNPVSEYHLSRFAATNIEQDAVHALLSFMHDFIMSEGPINVDDPKLKQYVIDNFPEESAKYVQDCGGLRKFLLRSVDFALLDDTVCVKEHVIRAQEKVVAGVKDKFKTNKYTMSDKFHAQKLAHLIEDSKLSRSSSSSSLFSSNTSTSWSNGIESGGAASNGASVAVGLSHNQSFNSGFFSPANKTVLASDNNSTLVDDGFCTGGDQTTRDGISSSVPCASVGGSSSSSSVSQLDQFEPPVSCGTPRRPSTINMASTPRKHSSVTGGEDSADLDVSTHRLFEVPRDDDGLAAESAMAAMQEKLQEALQTVARREQQLQQEVDTKNELQKKLAQIRNKNNKELSTLKKQRENEEEIAQAERRRTEQAKSQLTAEQRRMQGEKHKLIEENKALLSKVNALQLHNDQLVQQAGEVEAEVDQLTMRSSRLEDQLRVVQASLSSAAERARKAEQGYIDLNRSLTEKVINSVLTACRYEVFTMLELERHVTADTWPNARLLADSRREVEEHIRELEGELTNLGTMSEKFSSMLNAGRPLNSLPRQSLPSVPDTLLCTKAIYLLNVNQTSSAASRVQNQRSGVTAARSQEPPHILRPSAGLAMSSIDSGTASTDGSPVAIGARKKTDSAASLGTALNSASGSVLAKEKSYLKLMEEPPMKISATNRVNQLLLSLGVGNPTGGSAAVVGSSCDPRNGVAVPSSGSRSPSSPGPPETNPLTSDAHQLFVGKLPPTFTNDQLKSVFARYGDVYSARIVDNTVNPNGKFGFVAFFNPRDRDAVLQRVASAPMTFGNYVFNVQPLDSSLQRKTEDARRAAATRQFAGQTIVPPSRLTTAAAPSRQWTPDPRQASPGPDVPIELDIKPKFQNMRPVARPEAAVGATLSKKPVVTINASGRQTTAGGPGPQSNNYHRLVEKCRAKLGPGFSDDDLRTTISGVRRLNNGSLSGLAEDTIVERVEQLLKRPPRKQNPWADLTPVTPPTALSHQAAVDVREEECCICVCVMDKPSEVIRLDCGHYFHTYCINQWLTQKQDCPICRTHTINKEDYPSLSSAH